MSGNLILKKSRQSIFHFSVLKKSRIVDFLAEKKSAGRNVSFLPLGTKVRVDAQDLGDFL